MIAFLKSRRPLIIVGLSTLLQSRLLICVFLRSTYSLKSTFLNNKLLKNLDPLKYANFIKVAKEKSACPLKVAEENPTDPLKMEKEKSASPLKVA